MIQMDWTTIIITALGGTSVLGLIQAVRYRRENKALKANEVKQSDVDTQRQQIELAELYKNKMLALLEQMSAKQDSSHGYQERIIDKLEILDGRVDGLDVRLANVVTYLNGDFQEFLRRQHGGKAPAKPRIRKTQSKNTQQHEHTSQDF